MNFFHYFVNRGFFYRGTLRIVMCHYVSTYVPICQESLGLLTWMEAIYLFGTLPFVLVVLFTTRASFYALLVVTIISR